MEEHLNTFCQIVLGDSELQHTLWQADTLDSFLDLAQRTGAAHGLHLTHEHILAAVFVSRSVWREHGALATEPTQLADWIPIRIRWRATQWVVEWCFLGPQRFTEPFFEQTVERCLRHPFNRLFRLQTPIDVLGTLHDRQPGLPPSGFLFHMSRCGSTLAAQMLAALPQVIVLAEAEPIDAVLRAHVRYPAVTDQQRATWLRWVISALGRQRFPHEQHVFIKFDSWSIIDLPLIRHAFPHVPWLFMHRDPVEVMVSHQRIRGSQMVPGMIEPAMIGRNAADQPPIQLDEYCAQMLARICEEAARAGEEGDGWFVNYRQLPAIMWVSLLRYFGIAHTAADVARMQQAAQFHAKTPSMPFASDIAAKQGAATAELRRLAAQWVQPPYQRLLALPPRE